MKRQSISSRSMLSIVLFLYHGNNFAAGIEGVCKSKLDRDAYVPSNDLCQDNAWDNTLLVIERYRPRKEAACPSPFDITGTRRRIVQYS